MIRVSMGVLACCGPISLAQEIGPSTATEPYVLPVAPGVRTVSVLTVGETAAAGGTRMVGKPDGMGVYANGDGTFTVLMNHELSDTEGIVRRHGARGALVSQWTIGPDLSVLTGRDLIHTTHAYDKATQTYLSGPVTLDRYCSGDLAAPSAYRFGEFGTDALIYMAGEETRPPSSPDHGRAFAHVIDAEGAELFELPWMGRMSFENVVASPVSQLKTIVMGTDDASSSTAAVGTPSELYMYVGTKKAEGIAIERAGLTGGSLFGLRLPGSAGGESTTYGFGTTEYVGSARFDLVDFGDVSDRSGVTLQTQSIANNVYRFKRIEDGAWDPRPGFGNDFYFATTGDGSTTSSRVFRVRYDDLTQPELGGEITIMLRGDEGHRNLDNIGFDRLGHLLVQEDRGSATQLARIWQLSVDTGRFKLIARANSLFFTPRATNFLTTNEETTGIVDAWAHLGPGWFLFNLQAHYSTDVELDEGGQLLALFNPDSVCPGDRDANGVIDNADIVAYVGEFLAGEVLADLNEDGVLDHGDIGAFIDAYLSGCGL
ncbi:MAG: hypothetical protein ACI89L_001366 [Phycisphaerales bacterium]|jgi:hypothetical protein